MKNINPHLSLSLLWIMFVVVVNPIGNFPLNDDWAYAKNVFYLSEHGILKFSDWPAMTLISQMLWGATFCKVFGFSFTILRISTITIGLIGTNLIFILSKLISRNQKTAFFSTLVLSYNPLYFSLSCTFMTDIPFLVNCLLAFYFYCQYWFKPQKTWYIIAATAFSVIATLTRQTGLILPIVVLCCAFILDRKFDKKLLIHFIGFSLVAVILLIYIQWLKASGNMSPNFSTGSELFQTSTFGTLLDKFWQRSLILLFYNGMFLLPFLIYVFKSYWNITDHQQRLLLVPVSLLLSLCLFSIWGNIPVSNIINEYGLGPKALKGCDWETNLRPSIPQNGLFLIKIAACFGSSLIFFYFLSGLSSFVRVKRGKNKKPFINLFGNNILFKLKFLSLGLLSSYWLFLLLGNFFFDRYYLFLLPFMIFMIVPRKCLNSRIANVLSFSILAIYVFFSVSATHDYISWNRARWKALDGLITSGISPKNIDGGFEFNGWYETNKRNEEEQSDKSWWFVKDDEYAIAFGDLCGYQKVEKFIYRNFLNFDVDSIFILKRIDNTGYDTITIACDAENISTVNDNELMLTTDPSSFCEVQNARTNIEAHSGKFAVKLDNLRPFGFTIRLKGIRPCETILLSAFTKYNFKDAYIVASATGGRDLYFASTVADTLNAGNWKYLEMKVSQNLPMPSEITCYVWNNSARTVFFDDFKIRRIIQKPSKPSKQIKQSKTLH